MSQAAVRGPGRPRSAKAHKAMLDAAVALLSEDGYDKLTIEGVAKRAGVAKTTVYRRWATKEQLIVEALGTIAAHEDAPDTGDVRGDLLVLAERTLARMTRGELGRLLPGLVSEQLRNPDFARAVRERFVLPRQETVKAIVRRGIERGELRPDTDGQLVADLLTGPTFYEVVSLGRTPPRRYASALVDVILDGCRS